MSGSMNDNAQMPYLFSHEIPQFTSDKIGSFFLFWGKQGVDASSKHRSITTNMTDMTRNYVTRMQSK